VVLRPDRSHGRRRLVNLVGWIVQESSLVFRRFQTGLVQKYALLMLFGVFAFVGIYPVREMSFSTHRPRRAAKRNPFFALPGELGVPTLMNYYLSDHSVHAAGRRAPPAAGQQAERERHPLDRERHGLHRLRHLRAAVVLVQPAGDRSSSFQERLPWIPSIGAEYFIGIDGLSTLPDPADDDDGVHRDPVVVERPSPSA
jgi:hypothetical protein